MGFRYKIPIASTALSTANNLLTVIPAAARPFKVTEIMLQGLGTASAANEVGVYRISAAGTGAAPGAITPNPLNTSAPAAAMSANSGAYATTQPTLGAKLLSLGVNSNGGISYHRPAAGSEIEFQGGSLGLAIRSVSGTGNVTGWIEVEEI
jgi:hypothetical protein